MCKINNSKLNPKRSRHNRSDTSITVVVATHKPYRMPQDPMYVPIHVGAENSAQQPLPFAIADNTGDNISKRNYCYSELTGLYWLWKNNCSSYKGLVHYRRLLGSPNRKRRKNRDPFDRLLTTSEALSLFTKTEVIVVKKRKYYIETIQSHYSHTFESKQLAVTRQIIAEQCPQYLEAWDSTMASRSAHMFNMFIMRSDLFDSYCSWLFSILFELEQRIDPRQYDNFNARFIGRISEMMLDPWLQTHHLDATEVPLISPEPINWWKKGKAFLLAKFFKKKYTKSF